MSQDAPPDLHSQFPHDIPHIGPPTSFTRVNSYFAIQAAMAARDAEQASVERRSRRWKSAIGTVLVLAVLVGIVLAENHFVEESRGSAPASFPRAGQYAVETADFRFVMPTTPTIDTSDTTVSSFHVRSTSWAIDYDDLQLHVLATNFGTQLDERMAQGAFDAMFGGMARRGHGQVLSDEPFTQDGVRGRRTEIEIAGGRLFVEAYAKGAWIVLIVGGTPATSTLFSPAPPPAYDDLLASFAFN